VGIDTNFGRNFVRRSAIFRLTQLAGKGSFFHPFQTVGLLIGTVLLVGALTFIPALALGPVAEYLS
jgi:K+-transporting ATPase A subunit